MTLFVAIGALLALLSLALLTRPLWRAARSDAASVDAAAVASLRRQLEQLAAQKQSGALGAAQYAQARQALERRIVDAVANAPAPAASAPPAASKGLVLGLAGFVCAVAVAGYTWLGTPQALNSELAAASQAAGTGHSVTLEQVEAMIGKLEARLKDNPQDADGWAMLGRSHAVLGRHAQALPAFKQAIALRADDAALLTDYADALAMVNGRSLDGEPSRLIARALELDPSHLKALLLAGTQAFNHQDYALAVRHWEKMVQLAPDSELVQRVRGGIDEARRRAGGTAAAGAAPAALAATAAPAAPNAAVATPPPAGASISGTVTLAPALAAKAKPDDTLFVFARAAEGPRMPLAIVRKQVKDLPLAFTLDDSMAMTPTGKLSSAARVVVGARISARGDATPQPGDLQGFSAPVAPGAAGLTIEIAQVVATP
jgi:cytochrome c-type biogenesis protein CcmH